MTPVLSAKDADAPSLLEAESRGILPRYADCAAYIAGCARGNTAPGCCGRRPQQV